MAAAGTGSVSFDGVGSVSEVKATELVGAGRSAPNGVGVVPAGNVLISEM